jgi:hypothetical protein
MSRSVSYHEQERCYHPKTGRSKITYRSRAKAEQARVRMKGRAQLTVFSYECPHCGGWHVSKTPPR